jgi:conjugal transfer/entry exclusion protein
MDQFLLYSSLTIAIFALFYCLYIHGRVAKLISTTNNLDWDDVANITGDIATVKKTIQTLNNRINGMHSPKLQEEAIIAQLLQNAPNQMSNGKIKNVGG